MSRAKEEVRLSDVRKGMRHQQPQSRYGNQAPRTHSRRDDPFCLPLSNTVNTGMEIRDET
jgi:hypothetical protein